MKDSLKLIINSDDFGISDSVNKAIVGCFENGLISSTTLMANMLGFDGAVNYANTNGAVKNRVGLHMNLTEGQPLTDLIKKCERFCDKNGFFAYDRKKPIFFLAGTEKTAVYTEIKAQIPKLAKHHVHPTHLDSHHHVHTEFGIAKVYLDAAKEFGITKMRLSKNIGNASFPKKVYKKIFNSYIRNIKGITTTDYFCSANEFRSLIDNNLVDIAGSYEVMVHAKLDASGNLVDIDNTRMEDKIKPIVEAYSIASYQ